MRQQVNCSTTLSIFGQRVAKASDMQVDEAEVDRLHKIFYDKVAELFTQHKDSFKGYERVKLIMI